MCGDRKPRAFDNNAETMEKKLETTAIKLFLLSPCIILFCRMVKCKPWSAGARTIFQTFESPQSLGHCKNIKTHGMEKWKKNRMHPRTRMPIENVSDKQLWGFVSKLECGSSLFGCTQLKADRPCQTGATKRLH